MTLSVFGTPDTKTLLHLEAFLEVHGEWIYWWGTSDSPNTGCWGVQLDEDSWLVMTPYLKGDSGFIQIIDAERVGPDC